MADIPNLQDGSQPLSAERVFLVLRRRIGVILLCVLVAAGAAFGLSELQQKKYTASASLLFRNPGYAEDLFGTTVTTQPTDPTREAATNEKLVGLKIVGRLAAQHLDDLSPEEVSEMVSVSAEGESEVVSVSATSSDPKQAQLVANTFARQFIAFRAAADKSKLLQAKQLAEQTYSRLSPEEKSGVRGQALSRGAEKLGILSSLQTGNAELVQPASVPTSPSSPKPLRNTILGAILGLLLGVALAFVFERLNRRLRTPEEAGEVFGLPVIGSIPESDAIDSANAATAGLNLPFMEDESFRMLRASLRYFSVDSTVRSVLVTSSVSGAGKSTVTWNLARVSAHTTKTIIVETDLRNPALARQHGLRPAPGLAEVLTQQVDLRDAIQSVTVSIGAGGPDAERREVDVITSGALPPNPADLIESHAMSEVLDTLTAEYDLVAIDTPPLGVVSDAFPLLEKIDGVIVVARMGQTTREEATTLIEQLRRLKAPLLGVVANATKRRKRQDSYSYYAAGPPQNGANGAGANGAVPTREPAQKA
jgi:capsular exopolysaccharide synthesis family protein